MLQWNSFVWRMISIVWKAWVAICNTLKNDSNALKTPIEVMSHSKQYDSHSNQKSASNARLQWESSKHCYHSSKYCISRLTLFKLLISFFKQKNFTVNKTLLKYFFRLEQPVTRLKIFIDHSFSFAIIHNYFYLVKPYKMYLYHN